MRLVYVISFIAVCILVAGAADLSTRSATCSACHTREGAFAQWMSARLVTEKKGFGHELIGCASCHIEGGAANGWASRFRGLLHIVEYITPQLDPRSAAAGEGESARREVAPSRNCEYCHLGAIVRKAVLMKDLPEGLREIGLVMDHRKHVVAREDTCAKCHERYKNPETREADKTVNYAEVNHLGCVSCHRSASHSYRKRHQPSLTGADERKRSEEAAWKALEKNPRWMVALPSEETCRRCHDGRIHYKTKVFLAQCRTGNDYDACVKCHPLMTRAYFDRRRSGQGVAGPEPSTGDHSRSVKR
jgi:nitrate/TMAO reductase-like tetraheme cytochrome c subunit